jgi:rod shape-determining protein MreD
MRFFGPRLVPLAVTVIITQVALLPQLRILGVTPDLGLVAAVAIGYRLGAEPGAWFGFAVGLGYDLFLHTPTGLSALSYALCAYIVGSLERGLLRRGRWLPPFLGLAGGLLGGAIFLIVGGLAGVPDLGTVRAISIETRAALYDALVAPAVFALVNVVLRDEQPAWRFRDD